jgi:anti-sigma-K factor RskA
MSSQVPDHDAWLESAALYVIDAMAEDERQAFEAHLRECEHCRAEVASLQGVEEALAGAVPQIEPPPGLRDRVMSAALGAQQSRVVRPVFGAEKRATAEPPRAESSGMRWLPLAASLALSAGLGGYAYTLQQRISILEDQLTNAQAQAADSLARAEATSRTLQVTQTHLDVLTAPDATRVALAGQAPAPGASGRADWSRARGLALSLENLPQLQPGRTYQVWLLTAGMPVSAGLLTPDAAGRSTGVYAVPAGDVMPTGIALTEEPAGGLPQPTGMPILVGLLAQAG